MEKCLALYDLKSSSKVEYTIGSIYFPCQRKNINKILWTFFFIEFDFFLIFNSKLLIKCSEFKRQLIFIEISMALIHIYSLRSIHHHYLKALDAGANQEKKKTNHAFIYYLCIIAKMNGWMLKKKGKMEIGMDTNQTLKAQHNRIWRRRKEGGKRERKSS